MKVSPPHNFVKDFSETETAIKVCIGTIYNLSELEFYLKGLSAQKVILSSSIYPNFVEIWYSNSFKKRYKLQWKIR